MSADHNPSSRPLSRSPTSSRQSGGGSSPTHDEITEDYNEMIYAKTPEEIEKHRKAFIRKWRLNQA
jgi:hypothetical protein